ncbi:MAG TPA: sugar transferase [Candidatus Krumholzibacteria bacterium]|jgi:lipopolysaccharide/colanic/teichoic acid biosynthesis glycosyltransferase
MNLDPAMLGRVRRADSEPAFTTNSLDVPVPWYREVAPWQRSAKRAMDIGLSLVGLALFALVLPLLALAIKIDSRGPIFYNQQRVGINRRRRDRRHQKADLFGHERRHPTDSRDDRKVVAEGRLFAIHKLRTMYVDSEADGVRWATKGDPRITRVGRVLRQCRLDELPQFWNVLRGDMSLVGPRPERPPFITQLSSEIPGYLIRLRFRPGITGLAQVESGYDDGLKSVEKKVELDLHYMRKYSLRSDIRILLRSFGVVFTGKGAC